MGWVRPVTASQSEQFFRPPYKRRRSLHWGMRPFVGYRERAFGDCTRLFMGYLAKEPKVGKRRGYGGLGRNKHGKTKV